MTELIEGILKKTGGKDRSIRWFREKVKELGEVPPQRLIREGIVTARPTFGTMNFFMYSPKNKDNVDILPYYDRFPLIIPTDQRGGRFWGINFHYLPYGLRVQLFRRMLSFASDNNFDEKTTINVSWRQISSIRAVRPSIKSYLFSQVRSAFLNIRVNEMPVALNLPVQRFVGATDAKVYTDTRKMI